MSNIHTLDEIEVDSPGRRGDAFPDPWRNAPRDTSAVPMVAGGVNQLSLSYIAVDGNLASITTNVADKKSLAKNFAAASCCPCLIGGACAPQHKVEWINFLKMVTCWLIVIQLIMFVISLCLHGFAPLSENPEFGPPVQSLVTLGAKYPYAMRYEYQVFRFITPIFLHAGIIHLAANLLAEFRIGVMLERRWGIITYCAIYFVSGLGATLLSCLLSPNTVGVGASGALMGIMGAYLVELLMVGAPNEPIRKLELFQVLFFIAFTLLISFAPYIDFSAHIGGLLVGMLLGCSLLIRNGNLRLRVLQSSLKLRLTVVIITAVAAGAYFIIGLPVFYSQIHPDELYFS